MGKPNPVALRARREQGASAMPKATEFHFAKDDLDEATPSRSSGRYYSYSDVVELVDEDIHFAIEIAQTQLQKANNGVRDELYICTMTGLAYAAVIAESDEEWERCCADPFWEEQVPDRSNPVLAAFKLVRRTLRGPKYEQTRFHAKAMLEAYRLGIKPVTIKTYIKRSGGFKKLHDAQLARERAERDPLLEDHETADAGLPDALSEDTLQMDEGSAAEPSDIPSDEETEPDPSAPSATLPSRTKRYADHLKASFASR